MFRKILYILLCVVDIYMLYSSVGFFIVGYRCPKIVGSEPAIFMGNYILSLVFGLGVILLTTILIVCGVKRKRNR